MPQPATVALEPMLSPHDGLQKPTWLFHSPHLLRKSISNPTSATNVIHNQLVTSSFVNISYWSQVEPGKSNVHSRQSTMGTWGLYSPMYYIQAYEKYCLHWLKARNISMTWKFWPKQVVYKLSRFSYSFWKFSEGLKAQGLKEGILLDWLLCLNN